MSLSSSTDSPPSTPQKSLLALPLCTAIPPQQHQFLVSLLTSLSKIPILYQTKMSLRFHLLCYLVPIISPYVTCKVLLSVMQSVLLYVTISHVCTSGCVWVWCKFCLHDNQGMPFYGNNGTSSTFSMYQHDIVLYMSKLVKKYNKEYIIKERTEYRTLLYGALNVCEKSHALNNLSVHIQHRAWQCSPQYTLST